MVVVPVRADDGDDGAVANRLGDRVRVVGGVDHQHLVIVAEQPHVVLDGEVLAVEGEAAVGADQVDAEGHG